MEQNQEQQFYELGELFEISWNIFKQYYKVILSVIAIITIPLNFISTSIYDPATIQATLMEVLENGAELPIKELSGFFIISALTNVLVILSITNIVDICSKEETPDIQLTFNKIAVKIIPAIILWVLYSVLVLMGTMFFILPGVVIGVLGFFGLYSISISEQTPIEALKYSKNIISGYAWKVFAYIIVIAISNILVTTITTIPLSYVSDSIFWNTIISINNALISSFFYVIYAVMFINYRNVFESTNT